MIVRKTGRKMRMAVVAGIAATAMTGAMAHAAEPPDDGPNHKTGSGMAECPTNRICFYAGTEFNNNDEDNQNDIWVAGRSWKNFNYDFNRNKLDKRANDDTESIVNNTDHPVHVFRNYRYGGDCLTIKPRSWVTSLEKYNHIGRALRPNHASSMSTDPMFTNHCYPAYKS